MGKMDKHTKGPWTIETPCGFPYSGIYIVPVVRKDFPFYIAQIRQLREREESEANADLIASATTLKQQRDDLRNNLQAIVDDATEQVKKMVAFKQTRVLIKLKLIANAKAEIAKCEA